MKALQKRLDRIEAKTQGDQPLPFVAMIESDGVTLQHADMEDFCFPDEDSLDHWLAENGSPAVFKVNVVNTQPKAK